MIGSSRLVMFTVYSRMLPGWATQEPPTMNSYSVFARNESASPPCQPARPTPPRTASRSPLSCCGVMVPIVTAWTTSERLFIFAASR